MNEFYYNWFLMCWQNGTVTEEQLQSAVEFGYITEEQRQEIINSSQ